MANAEEVMLYLTPELFQGSSGIYLFLMILR